MSEPWDKEMVNCLKINMDMALRDRMAANAGWTAGRLHAAERRVLSKANDSDVELLLIHELDLGWTARRIRGIMEDIAAIHACAPAAPPTS